MIRDYSPALDLVVAPLEKNTLEGSDHLSQIPTGAFDFMHWRRGKERAGVRGAFFFLEFLHFIVDIVV